MTVDEVRDLLRREADKAPSRDAFARSHGFSPQYLSDVLSGRRDPGNAILRALKLERDAVYRRLA